MAPDVTLGEAVATGERLVALKALAGRLAVDLDSCGSARDVSSLSQRLMDVLAQIDELGGGVAPKRKATALDEFTQRLADRKSGTAAARRTAG